MPTGMNVHAHERKNMQKRGHMGENMAETPLPVGQRKNFAYRMCAKETNRAMSKPSFLCQPAFSRSMVVMSCAVYNMPYRKKKRHGKKGLEFQRGN